MDANFRIEGIAELSKKLNELSAQMEAKAIRSAVLQATNPALQKMKLAVPVGSKAHKTYKGRLVAPGFLKRNIKRKSYIDKKTGSIGVVFGVAHEAFYGVVFLDRDGGYSIKKKAPGEKSYHRKTAITVGHVRGRPWFKKNFINSSKTMIERFKESLAKKINKITQK